MKLENKRLPRSFFLVPLILLNAIPLVGVFAWGWKSFDLIFLYWLENVFIGAFTVLRMLIRPYHTPLELILPLFMASFFTLHYGMFTAAHGMFVFSLFGGSEVALDGLVSVYFQIVPLIQTNHLAVAAISLLLLQLSDWGRDVIEQGVGGEGLQQLMTAPYRRIVILHITIIASGFSLIALSEPVVGLVILVVFKTLMDIYHWHKDAKLPNVDKPVELDAEALKKLDEQFSTPGLNVNGKRVEFASYAELKASKQYRLMMSLVGMFGGQRAKLLNTYLDQKIALEQKE